MAPNLSSANSVNGVLVNAKAFGNPIALHRAVANLINVYAAKFSAWITLTLRTLDEAHIDRVERVSLRRDVLKVCQCVIGFISVDVVYDVLRRRLSEKRPSDKSVNQVPALSSVAAHHDDYVALHDGLRSPDADRRRLRGAALDSSEIRHEVSIAELWQRNRPPFFAIQRRALWLRLYWQMRPRTSGAYVGDCRDRHSVSCGQSGLRFQARSNRDYIGGNKFSLVVLLALFTSAHLLILQENAA